MVGGHMRSHVPTPPKKILLPMFLLSLSMTVLLKSVSVNASLRKPLPYTVYIFVSSPMLLSSSLAYQQQLSRSRHKDAPSLPTTCKSRLLPCTNYSALDSSLGSGVRIRRSGCDNFERAIVSCYRHDGDEHTYEASYDPQSLVAIRNEFQPPHG
jgi:hypothetical protein